MIDERIYLIRGHRVILSHDIADLYQVQTKALVQAVKRNKDRFPADFMFQLSWQEAENLASGELRKLGLSAPNSRSQIVTLKHGKNIKYLPYAFTEEGVAMLSGVLKSKQAVRANIAIMRAFVKLRQMLSDNREMAAKLAELEKKIEKHDHEIIRIFATIRELMSPSVTVKRQIGFHVKP